jgi:Protein of unknown function (DUF3142)
LVAALLSVLLTSCSEAPGRVDAAAHDAFYLWAGVEPQPVLERARTVYILAAEVRRDGSWVPLRAGVPQLRQPELWLVVRAASLEWDPEAQAALARDLARWRSGNRLAGVQIDFDAATAGLAGYAAFLRDLRQTLPADLKLSITGLMDWSAQADPAALAALRGVVDEVVVQSYQGRTTIPGYDRYLARLARVPVPHKVALVQGGLWQEPPVLRQDPLFRGYVVFLLNR